MTFLTLISLTVCVAIVSSYTLRNQQLAFSDQPDYADGNVMIQGGNPVMARGLNMNAMNAAGGGMNFAGPVQHQMAYRPVNMVQPLSVQTVRNVPYVSSALVARQTNVKAIKNTPVSQRVNVNAVQNVPVSVMRTVNTIQHVPATTIHQVPAVQNVPYTQTGYVNAVERKLVRGVAQAEIKTPVVSNDNVPDQPDDADGNVMIQGLNPAMARGLNMNAMNVAGGGMNFAGPVQHQMAYRPVNMVQSVPVQTVRNVPYVSSALVARQTNVKAIKNTPVSQRVNVNVVQNVPVSVQRTVNTIQHVPATTIHKVPAVQNIPYTQTGYVSGIERKLVPGVAQAEINTPVVSNDGVPDQPDFAEGNVMIQGGNPAMARGLNMNAMNVAGGGMNFAGPVQHQMAYRPVNVVQSVPVQTVRNVPVVSSALVARQTNVKAIKNTPVSQRVNVNAVQNVPVSVQRTVNAIQHVPATTIHEIPAVQNIPYTQTGYVSGVERKLVPGVAQTEINTPVVSNDGGIY